MTATVLGSGRLGGGDGIMAAACLAGWALDPFDDGRWRRDVYRKGEGPAVIVIHEMPNLHPQVVRFAEAVVAAGMTVYLPSLFGEPGRTPTRAYTVGQMLQAICIRREFNVWANGRSSPIVDWLRALARSAHAACGGRGVGALGMCFTGGFALAMMTEPSVVAPVLSQPSLPLGGAGRARIDASEAEIACARRRFETEDLTMIGLRFHGDPLSPGERFRTLKTLFGDRFEAIELDPMDARPGVGMAAHSVLTLHLVDEPGSATKAAEERVIAFLRERVMAS
jgi:dienelactone hydrolase